MFSSKTSHAGGLLAATATARRLAYGVFLVLLVATTFAFATAVERDAVGLFKEPTVLLPKRARAEPTLAVPAALKRLAYVVILVALVALIVGLSAAVIPRLFGYRTLAISGGSMGETTPNGSLVIARWMEAEDVEINDVILIATDSAGEQYPKLHRVVSLDEEGGQILVQTKGDANDGVDPGLFILPDRVLTPVYTLPFMGHVVGFAKTPIGWVLMSALPAAVLCIAVLRSIWATDGSGVVRPGRI